MLDPAMILMDEPSGGLAPVMVQHLETILAKLKQHGIGILLVEQNLHSALAVADHVYVFDAGTVVHEADAAAAMKDFDALTRHLGVH